MRTFAAECAAGVFQARTISGLPEKSAPCGQADPGTPVVPTNIVSTFHAGDTITITIEAEKVFHPGHYRVSLAKDQGSLPADPNVTIGATHAAPPRSRRPRPRA